MQASLVSIPKKLLYFADKIAILEKNGIFKQKIL